MHFATTCNRPVEYRGRKYEANVNRKNPLSDLINIIAIKA